MAARSKAARVAIMAGVVIAGSFCPAAQSAGTSSAPPDSRPQTSGDQSTSGTSSSSKSVYRKTGPDSSETIRHIQVREQDASSPELTQAENFIQDKNYAAAEPLLEKVTGANPANYEAWFDLGFVENSLGKADASIAAYRKSVAAKPDVFESNLNLGIQLAKAHQPDAEQFLRAATTLTPTSHPDEGRERAWLSLAHTLEATKPDDALAAYRQAGALQPKDPEPHVAAGRLLESENRFSDAEQEYKAALALDPGSDALTGLANLYMRGRRFPEAEEYLRKVAAQQPREPGPHIQLGRVLAAEGKDDAAIAELEAGAKLAPTDLTVQRDLADLYTAAGKPAQAEAAYRSLLAIHPADADLHRDLGESLLLQKKFVAAEQEFFASLKLDPNSGEAYGDLAFAASENKDYPLTLKALDARARFLPEIASTYFMRASALDHLRDYKDAAVNYHLFLKTANGKYPDQEWQAQHRLIAIEPKK